MDNDWVLILVAAITALPATYAAYLAGRVGKAIQTPGNTTLGQQVSDLQASQMVLRDEMRVIAQEKVLAEARLTSAALAAIARLGEHANDPLLKEAASRAADRVEVEADRVARRMERDNRTNEGAPR